MDRRFVASQHWLSPGKHLNVYREIRHDKSFRTACDVAKDALVMATSASESIIAITNASKTIRAWLKNQAGPIVLAAEATLPVHVGLEYGGDSGLGGARAKTGSYHVRS